MDTDSALRFGSEAGQLFKTVRTWKALKEDGVVMQSSDYSCGAAAVATLLTHTFGDEVGERAIMDAIVHSLSATEKKDRQEHGFSLLDLSDFVSARGYESTGFRLSFAQLRDILLPALVHLSVEGNRHFVVLERIQGDRIYLADPSHGHTRLSVDAFAKQWTHIVLVVTKAGGATPPSRPADPEGELVLDRMLSAYTTVVRTGL